jgi:RimJ/RimL family protein N-acetyltransferase
MRDVIETERLVLRQLKETDAIALSKYGSHFDIARMTGSFPHPFPLISAEFKIMYLKSLRERDLAYPYAITEKGNDEMIGIMDLFRKDLSSALEIGYWIAEPHWGKGYACEAGEAILSEASDTFGNATFKAGVFSDNPASQRVLEKLGFKRTGDVEEYFSMARMKKAESLIFEKRIESLEMAAE